MSKKVFVIRDSNNRYEGHLNINSNNMETGKGDYAWDYSSKTFPNSWDTIRENAELKLNRLIELNELAEYPIQWEIISMSEQEIDDIYEAEMLKGQELGLSPFLTSHNNSSTIKKDIQRGYITKQRKLVDAIYRKYKSIRLAKAA